MNKFKELLGGRSSTTALTVNVLPDRRPVNLRPMAALNSGITAALVAKIPSGTLTHETWEFTLEGGTTVEKEVTLWT